MVKARKYVVVKSFDGLPKKDDLKIVEEDLPPLQDGEILVKTEWISVDPYLKTIKEFFGLSLPFDQPGYQVAIVEESRNAEYPVGTRVVSHKGWRDYTVINPNKQGQGLDIIYKLPDLNGSSPGLGIGVIGNPGITAYFGFLEICKPKVGETVVVTGAAGGVGSVVGQIAKIKGCKVIGFAGSDEKVAWLEKELGFDKAFNYKKVDANKVLKEAAPNGIDCFFDNVGGDMSNIIISQMNTLGRVSICGFGVDRNGVDLSTKAPILPLTIISKQLKIEGFWVTRWNRTQWLDAVNELAHWVRTGQLNGGQHITEGFDNVYEAFIDMLNGKNIGKAVVKV